MRIEIEEPRWPDLQILLAGYLNEDWSERYSDVWPAIVAFRAESSPESVRGARLSIERILTESADEHSLRAVCDELGCGYYPPGDGMTYRQWLARVAELLGD